VNVYELVLLALVCVFPVTATKLAVSCVSVPVIDWICANICTNWFCIAFTAARNSLIEEFCVTVCVTMGVVWLAVTVALRVAQPPEDRHTVMDEEPAFAPYREREVPLTLACTALFELDEMKYPDPPERETFMLCPTVRVGLVTPNVIGWLVLADSTVTFMELQPFDEEHTVMVVEPPCKPVIVNALPLSD